MTKYIKREDGEGFVVPLGEIYRIACCDCGLVHDVVFVYEDGVLAMAAKRNNRATGQRRRKREKRCGRTHKTRCWAKYKDKQDAKKADR